jgi:tetratricopeptide (TPR) repeat protein
MGDVPDRHRSVRAVFDYTWKQLSTEEQEVFAALSVFRGGFTREAADAVAGASLRDLSSLTNKSLVVPSPDTGRYAVHELLRQYAEAELEADSNRYTEVLEAHAAYYSGLAEEGFRLIHHNEQPRMMATIEGDLDNIRLAWQHSLATHNAHCVRQIIPAIWIVFEVSGWYQAAVALLSGASDTFGGDSTDDEMTVARALASAVRGWFLAMLGRQDEGAAAAASAIETLRSSADREALWLAMHCRGVCLLYQGKFDELAALAVEALDVADGVEGLFSNAAVANWQSMSAQMTGDLGRTKELLEGMESYRQLDEQYYLSWHFMQQARLAMIEGRLQSAVDLAGRSVQKAGEIGYHRVMHVSSNVLGDANAAAGNLDAAEQAYIRALAIAEQLSMVREMVDAIAKVAKIRAVTGRKGAAVSLLATVLAESASAQKSLFQGATIGEASSVALEDLRGEMDDAEFAAAFAAGSSRPYDVAAKELIDSLPAEHN